jgi:aminoglycoside phosphotransferase (APT) family kinase protein
MPRPDIDIKVVVAILRRVFLGERSITFERMRSGGSTQVYRLHRSSSPFYLRFGEDPEDTFAPEAWVHDRLEALGVQAPRVVVFEDVAKEIERSIMVTTEIPGRALEIRETDFGGAAEHTAEIFRGAGRDLALITSIPVNGFGFVQRARPWNGTLSGPYPTFFGWFSSTLGDLSNLQAWFLDEELDVLSKQIARTATAFEGISGALAHGDFDTSHIFSVDDCYSGVIDFGEIRGADRWFDLASFLLLAGGWNASPTVVALFQGFAEIQRLGWSDFQLIHARAVTLGVFWLQRQRGRDAHHVESELVRSIRNLLTTEVPSALIG